MQIANVLSIDKQRAIISALAEGSGIRQIQHMTGVHGDTIMRLGVRIGKSCISLMDGKMRNSPCQNPQFDELWGFIGKNTYSLTTIRRLVISGHSARLIPIPSLCLRSSQKAYPGDCKCV
jgi:hypothetical protein